MDLINFELYNLSPSILMTEDNIKHLFDTYKIIVPPDFITFINTYGNMEPKFNGKFLETKNINGYYSDLFYGISDFFLDKVLQNHLFQEDYEYYSNLIINQKLFPIGEFSGGNYTLLMSYRDSTYSNIYVSDYNKDEHATLVCCDLPTFFQEHLIEVKL